MVAVCPVCKSALKSAPPARDDRNFFECPRCGPYSLTGTAAAVVEGLVEKERFGAARLSYTIRRMTGREQWAMLSSNQLTDVFRTVQLPNPAEQLNNLIQWLAEVQPSPGEDVQTTDDLVALVGATNDDGLGFVIHEAIEQGLVRGEVVPTIASRFANWTSLGLTFKGWAFYEEIAKGRVTSSTAFMAMKFGDNYLDTLFRDAFIPTVKATGFDLLRLDQVERAGLIDDKLRVEIRRARFLIADLTHHNNGAYWEAGYAEGLGKPVIYTCRKDVFEDKSKGTHFDTNHHLTIAWEADNIADAMERLKATIRATLPDEAVLSDAPI